VRRFCSHGFIKLILANEDYVVGGGGVFGLMVRFKENLSYTYIVILRQSINANTRKMVLLPFVRKTQSCQQKSGIYRTVHRLRPLSTGALHGRLQRVTIPEAVTIQFGPPEDEHNIARSMPKIIRQYIYYRIKELCIKLVIETSLYYDARSEKHQTTMHVTDSKLVRSIYSSYCTIMPVPVAARSKA
jgi:hypothetical protein